MQAIEVKRSGGRVLGFGFWLRSTALVTAAVLAIGIVLLVGSTLNSASRSASNTVDYRASGQTQQSQHGNLAGDGPDTGAAVQQSGHGNLP